MGLDFVEVIMNVEEEFAISIPDARAEQLLTCGALADYVVEALASRALRPPEGTCPGSPWFYRLRKRLLEESAYSVPRERIRPSSLVWDALPPGSERATWTRVAREFGIPERGFRITDPRGFGLPPRTATFREIVERLMSRRGHGCWRNGVVDADQVWGVVRGIVSKQLNTPIESIVGSPGTELEFAL